MLRSFYLLVISLLCAVPHDSSHASNFDASVRATLEKDLLSAIRAQCARSPTPECFQSSEAIPVIRRVCGPLVEAERNFCVQQAQFLSEGVLRDLKRELDSKSWENEIADIKKKRQEEIRVEQAREKARIEKKARDEAREQAESSRLLQEREAKFEAERMAEEQAAVRQKAAQQAERSRLQAQREKESAAAKKRMEDALK